MPKFLSKDVLDDGRVTFTLGNGKVLTVNPEDYPTEIRGRLTSHGASQKIGDGTSGFSKKQDFAGAWEAMTSIHEALMAGNWEREGGGFGVSIEDLSEAIAKLKKVDIAKAKAAVDSAPVEKRREWASNKQVAAEIQAIRLRRAKEAAKQETDELEINL